MVYNNIVKDILNNGGTITPIYIPNKHSNGTGLCNASILFSEDKLRIILRSVDYTLYCCDKYQSCFEGPLSYYHRDNDLNLRTTNFYCELNKNKLTIQKYNAIDTRKLDVKPIWNFIGLEDARLIFWDNKYYMCGVRRDTTPHGQGRMEMCELNISNNSVEEISRHRIEVPDTSSYCEKNWMPIKDKPFHFIKWTNPTEVVKMNLNNNTSERVFLSDKSVDVPFDIRGGSQLIPWDDNCYLAITHECKFVPKNFNGYKEADYYHRFVIWNSDFSIKHISNNFNFMTGRVEFCIGLEQVDDHIIIIFGFYDNACYAIKIPKSYLNTLIWKTLKNN